MTGVGSLVRLALRTERLRLPIWVFGLVLLPYITFRSYAVIFPTETARAALTSVADTPAFQVIVGQPVDLTTAGGFTAWRTLVAVCALAGMLAILIVLRHTRTEEDAGRAELLAGTPLARLAWPIAAIIVAAAATTLVGAAIGGMLILNGANSMDALLMGAAIALCGMAFGAIALTAAQIASSARVALGVSIVVLAGSFLLRGWADADPEMEWLAWITPLGWAERVRPFGDTNAVPLVLLLICTAAFLVLALAIDERRDLGRGRIAERPGPAFAPSSLRSPLSLAIRMQRGTLIGWTIGLVALGIVYGTVQGSVATTLASNPMFQDAMQARGEADFVDAFIATIVSVLGLFATGYGLSTVLRMRPEEADGRVELLLSTAVRRTHWFGSNVIVAIIGSAWVVLAGTLGFALGAQISGSSTNLASLLGSAAGQFPAVFVLLGLAALLIGLRPRMAPVVWAVFAYSAVIGFFGPLLDIPELFIEASPFTHLPQLPQDPAVFAPYAILCVIALALAVVGILGIQRRDVPSA